MSEGSTGSLQWHAIPRSRFGLGLDQQADTAGGLMAEREDHHDDGPIRGGGVMSANVLGASAPS
ncbi:hypothetical protein RBSWK_02009 [Rhodopirellula baltica SWK14]|uniref:Uncharacterized protein n=1 Tax=Rhodopirellula baltica SWK14 TaxID=993516 RepID=L7CIM5_RHOBT|nr:hypothetical protein RBSWK_02009 [Rhodopirellula baltica SWK14]